MSAYAFLDCGDGRRLERLAGVTVSRPAPAAMFPRKLSPDEWRNADLSFDRDAGWTGAAPDDWRVELGGAVLGLRPAAGGQIGVFPEHAEVCDALADALAVPAAIGGTGARRVLNLFAHTGQATLRLAALQGTEVTHVDAAPAAVKQARINVELSGLADRPVRWLTDDALGFLRRAARRGDVYDAILADPPAYGRSKKGGEWKLERDLPELLSLAGRLLAGEGAVFCLTCHREGWTPEDAARAVRGAMPGGDFSARPLALCPEGGGNALPAGCMVMGRNRMRPSSSTTDQ